MERERGNWTTKRYLLNLMMSETLITQVYVLQTQIPGEPALTGVRVVGLEGEYVRFESVASPGAGYIVVVIDKIVAIEV